MNKAKKKKHIIIAGTSRSGKTTLASMIRKKRSYYNYIPMDSIKRGIFNNFVKTSGKRWPQASPKLVKLMNSITGSNNSNINKHFYIFDIPTLYPRDVANLNNKDTIVIFLGYPNITTEKKIELIQKHDPKCYWSYGLSKDKLRKIVVSNIKFSKFLEKECKDLNIKFFDTSKNREVILKKALKYLEAQTL